jgi:hypothetical protein
VVATVAKVGFDLASPDGGPAACIAEEIVLNGIFEYARRIMDDAQLGRPWMDLSETLLEDIDFEMLFAEDLDGIEHDPAKASASGCPTCGTGSRRSTPAASCIRSARLLPAAIELMT